ncbi:MAG: N-acetylneuraminate synthase [Alphaproteobacteria bacterium]|nr:N-acetylneuraminate synthase [Alphaproteobacteria bacterium]MBO4643806.1 N-acetylneuraminate synthase [Alphaproteobacteria bacterium]
MNKTFIIAEAGVNHNGSFELAKKLIDAAAEAGADCVKFQTFKADTIVSKSARKAEYQQKTTDAAETQYQMLKRLELSENDHKELQKYCREKGVMFLSTPFDTASVDFLDSLGVEYFKVPSGEITNLPYLRKINSKRKPVIMSSGMASLNEIKEALAVLKDCNVSLLHCTTEYPCPYEAVNLKAMLTMRDAFHLPVGYSDHTKGIEVPIAAVAMGATIIEKHFTLDRNMEGPDHKASLEPDELKAMVAAIRHIEAALGTGEKEPAECEKKNIAVARKSIVAKRAIKKGEILSEENLTVKRPGDGISPMRWDEIIGTPAARDYNEDEKI